MENYKKVESKYIDDIKSTVTIYQHIKTGAKICTIENSDDNKVFAISFRTPPMDSTGLTHILEHSVLCGSKKYPAKDPFVSLLKGSLNTFLNALTFSDKTVYPLASCNLKDFKNLMGVYMDAVLYPNIYKHKEIFMQEGWHYDINTKDEPLKFNGVVFNEMKGDFSNPDSLLFHAILKSLHPTTAYQYESGGDPKEIPSLSYESFLEFHHKYYNPTNSFIYIYGNCDMEERLKWMDKEYLSKFDKIEFNTEIQSEIPFKFMKSEEIFYPVGPGEDLKDKTSIALSFGLQDNKDIKLSIAIKIINDLILESPGAFLKKAILDSKIAKSVDSAIEDEIKQPFYSIILKNSNKESIDQFVKIFSETLTKAIKDGLDHEAILADINFLEFKTREGQFGRGIPQGLTYIFASLGTWLYDEKKPYSALENLACFAQLREDLSKGYFEEVIKHYLLDSTYKSLVLCSPSNTLQDENEKAEIERLASIKAKLSDTEIDSLIKANAELKIYQSEPSTKEAIAALPHLGLADINPEPKVYPSEKRSIDYPIYFQNLETNGIVYGGYLFRIEDISNEYLPYVSFLSSVLGELKTKKHSESELNKKVKLVTGGITTNLNVDRTDKDRKTIFYFAIQYSCLKDNVDKASALADEILFDSLFEEGQIYEKLCQQKSELEQGLSYQGHVFALRRAASYIDEVNYINDSISGIGYLDFIESAVKDYESKKTKIVETLNYLRKMILSKFRFMGYCTSHEDGYSLYKNEADKIYNKLDDTNKEFSPKLSFKKNILNEGIEAPYNIVFDGQAGKYSDEGYYYSGSLKTILNPINMDYLWTAVRVKMGAYGCGCLADPSGLACFYSYRDPNIASTLETYQGVPNYLKNLKLTDEELLEYKIGAIGNEDTVLHVSAQGLDGFKSNLKGLTYETKKLRRQALLDTKQEDFAKSADIFAAALAEHAICVIGSETIIEQNKGLLKTIRKLVA